MMRFNKVKNLIIVFMFICGISITLSSFETLEKQNNTQAAAGTAPADIEYENVRTCAAVSSDVLEASVVSLTK